MSSNNVVVLVGAGIVGLATAYRLLLDHPGLRLLLIEKEMEECRHQSGHNSGVIHSGIYYKPGSLKALNCRAGRLELLRFCGEHGIRHELCGKLIVAVDENEIAGLEAIFHRGKENGVNCQMIPREALREREPHCAGVRAVRVDDAGIIDFPAVCRQFRKEIQNAGGVFYFGERVKGIVNTGKGVRVQTGKRELEADWLVNCAGLYSDKVAAMDLDPGCQIVPFRGEYFMLKESSRHLCRHLIYPVPDPAFPFLGVHFTRRVSGGVECGPNAVLAFAREGYKKTDIHLGELAGTVFNPAFVRMAAKHWRMSLGEYYRSFSKTAFVRALQRLIPEIQGEDMEPAPAGVRAQAMDPLGKLVDDFVIRESERAVHICNAPSPAATACLTIGREVASRLGKKMAD